MFKKYFSKYYVQTFQKHPRNIFSGFVVYKYKDVESVDCVCISESVITNCLIKMVRVIIIFNGNSF